MKAMITRGMGNVLSLIIAALFPWGTGYAEVVKNISIGGVYDSNAYGSYAEKTDYITQVGIYLARRTGSDTSDFEVFYTGNGNIFAQSNIRTFTVNSVGLAYGRKLGQGQSGLAAGGKTTLRLDRSCYNIYDYFGGQGYVNGRWYVRPSVLVRLGYRLRLREYWNLDEFNYSEHYVFTQISKFLPSRTTFRGDVSFGYKDYRDPGRETFGSGWGGRNPMAVVPVDAGVPNEGQVVLAFQVAQSLGDNTGLSLRYQARLNTTSDRYHLTGEESGYSEDDDLFNDRYDYEGHRWTMRLTQRFRKGLRIVIAGGCETQDYDGRPALDLQGEPVSSGALREDRTTFASLSVQKPLTQRVVAGAWYGFERNRSNDVYYDYNGRHSLSVGFDVRF